MCLIAYTPENCAFPERLINSVFESNSDGFGMMFSNGDGTVTVEKLLPTSVDDTIHFLDAGVEINAAYHWRMRTHGNIDLSQVHPYPVLSQDSGDDIDIYLMHNGILRCVNEVYKSKSDTWHFIEGFLRPVLLKDPDLLYDADFIVMLENMIGSNNKFLIFRGDDIEPIIVNEDSGVNHDCYDGCWLSNTYAYTDPEYNKYGYKSYSRAYDTYSSYMGGSSYSGYNYHGSQRGRSYVHGYGYMDDHTYKDSNILLPTSTPDNNDTDLRDDLEIDDVDLTDPYAAASLSYAQLMQACLARPDEAAELVWQILHEGAY